MSKQKIFNDPIYGLVSYPYDIIYDLIDHPYFQRLRRIQQLGMSSIVYPGATHSRFHHALGALHLCDTLINNLILKGVNISQEEHEAVLIAILLHDIGHGPYSHALERVIISMDHEDLTIRIMHLLNEDFGGRLSMAIAIFTEAYHRPFLSQIISSQIDVDRMDYLNRDSYYTGVAEGIIGYDRIIKMMMVVDEQLVIEEKGIHSVERFLLARYFMYHQVYQHKAALSADHMLKIFFREYKIYLGNLISPPHSVVNRLLNPSKLLSPMEQLALFLRIDDSDILMLLKSYINSEFKVLAILAKGLINRDLFGLKTKESVFHNDEVEDIIKTQKLKTCLDIDILTKLINLGTERNALYEPKDEIKVLKKNDSAVVTFGDMSRLKLYQGTNEMYFVTYPTEKV